MLRVGDLVEIRGERDGDTAELFGVPAAEKTTLAQAHAAEVVGGGQ